MIATVSGVSIDLSRLEAISMAYRGGDWGDIVVLTLKPTIQYVQNPETNEWELHHANTVIEQPCIEYDSMVAKYDKWVKLWEEFKEDTDKYETDI